MSVFQLLYVSQATANPITNELVQDILSIARKENRKVNVTGLLIARGEYFFQVLEGDETSVNKLFLKIEKDKRHKNVQVLVRILNGKRIFTNWSMGFLQDDQNASIEALIPFIEQKAIQGKKNQETVLQILNTIAKRS
jgi:hypothetical protein